MRTDPSPARRLRQRLESSSIIRSLGAHDVLTALLMEKVGYETVFLGGFGASASLLGLPDLGYLGISDMADAVRRTTARVSIPVIADGDTGHGDLHHVARCVEELEGAGAAGILLEDQVHPKRCGHFEGKAVIPRDEMVLKIRAAVRARSDDDFLILARTDARALEGIDRAIERVNRYCDAGGDVAFVEAPTTVEEIEAIARRVPWPKFANMLTFGKTPILSARELEALGYAFVVAPIETLLVAVRAIERLAVAFLHDGDCRAVEGEMVTFEAVKALLGLPEAMGLREALEQGDEESGGE